MIVFSKKILDEESVASKLRLARESKEIGLSEAATKLNIKEEYLSALEKGAYSLIPGGIYEKLFLKKYSHFLGLNPKAIEKERQKERTKKSDEEDVFSKKKIEKKHFIVMPKIFRNIAMVSGFLILSLYIVFCLKTSLSAPKVEIFFPPENLVTQEKNIEISGRASEKTQITVNEKTVLKDSSGIFKENLELKNGLNSITILAKNRYGQETIIKRDVLVK